MKYNQWLEKYSTSFYQGVAQKLANFKIQKKDINTPLFFTQH